MIGAVIGDIIGSTYEFSPAGRYDFELFPKGSTFTDDTVLTMATADALLHQIGYAETYRKWALRYPKRGYGGHFRRWVEQKNPKPYNSMGNGSAMRVSPVGWAFATLQETLEEAKRSAIVTHNHSEGIKGAQSVAGAVFLARNGASKEEIRNWVTQCFDYDVSRKVEEIRISYHFDETCPGSVPEAFCAFLESTDFESAVRLAVWLGGDADTQACIAGALAEAFYGEIPAPFLEVTLSLLPEEMKRLWSDFSARYIMVL